MFGYIVCNKEKLAKQEIDRYQSVYCGLCKALERRFGQLSRMSLNYDMTFLILFLSSLYEPPEEEKDFRCAVHPLHMKKATANKYTDYAADMTIALSYYKCLDDWQDEHKHLQRHYAEKIEKNYQDVKARCPRQCKAIETEIARLSEIEKSASSLPDDAVNCFGRLMSELFVYEEDFWSSSLRTFGYELGRFIYLMDATMDYNKDLKKGNYNPLVSMGKNPEEMEDFLTMIIGRAAYQFEKLPLVQDSHLLRNILYGGVWQQYYARKARKERTHD
ncbi:MAG: DUF5685 family protein [Eubacteriales bacterium]|nr:DUF5685 family protein [Eubacteriales bacterium]